MMIRLYAYLKVGARKGTRQGNLPNRPLPKGQGHGVRLARGVQFNLLSSYKSPPPGYDPEQSGSLKGGLAQLVERLLCKQNVNGSNPLTSTSFNWAHPWKQGPVAQLVRAPP